ncbi:MAG: hypothetical protein HFJ49_01150 [Clostridia bacterium]|nr:hypothetical protein [Clostridia bacterium]
MNREEYLLNEFGIEIAREHIAKKVKQAMKKKNEKGYKENLNKLIQDLEKVERADMETIKSIWREIGSE